MLATVAVFSVASSFSFANCSCLACSANSASVGWFCHIMNNKIPKISTKPIIDFVSSFFSSMLVINAFISVVIYLVNNLSKTQIVSR